MARNGQNRGGRRHDHRDNHQNDYRNGYRDARPPPRDFRDRDRDYRDAPSSLPPRPTSRGYENNYRTRSYREPEDDRASNYRQSSDGYNNSYRPPPPRSPPPPAPGQPRHFDVQPPQGEFTFRFDKPSGVQETTDSYRPNGDRRVPAGPRNGRDRGFRRDHRGERGRGRARGHWRPFVAAERELLSARHISNEEHIMFNSENEVKYKAIDELSDSDEAEMDISGDEDDRDDQPSNKRLRLAEEKPAADGNAVPKWSNPDPYTALPPPDTVTNQKKKDVVQLIRKARVDAKEAKASTPTEAVDFISCDFDDSDESEDEVKPSLSAPSRPSTNGPSVPGAPSGPRATEASLPSKGKALPDNLPPRPPLPDKPAEDSRRPRDSIAKPEPSNQKNSALGSRKRTYDDQIKLPEHARLKKMAKVAAHGDLIADWKIIGGEDPCPWNEFDHSDSQMGVWLHKEIVDFYEHVRPRDFEDKIRAQVVDDLQTFCRNIYKKVSVLPFGSYPSGLYLPTGDMDLVFVSDQHLKGGYKVYDDKRTLWRLQGAIRSHSMAHLNEIEVISRAKVPLVKYIEKRTGLKMDISFENLTGVQAISTFRAWKEQYPAMPVIVTLVKQFLAMRGLNEPVNGGIGGFSVICLVVSMLQMMPQVQSESMNPAYYYGDLLMEFFDLYGNRFNFNDVAISLNPPKYIAKNNITAFPYNQTNRFSIIDPNNPENDISGGSSNTVRIVKAFSDAHRLLHDRMEELAVAPDKSGASILEVILAGNYSSFRLQREHLQILHDRGLDYEEKKRGPRQPKW